MAKPEGSWTEDPIVTPAVQVPPWEMYQRPASADRGPWTIFQQPAFAPVRAAQGVADSFVAGWQSSATGLALRGRLPDVVLDGHHATWYEKLIASGTQMVSDLPETVVGLAGGAAAGGAVGSAVPVIGTATGALIGGGAGAFALPTAIRQSYIEAYEKGEIQSSADFLDRAAIVLKATGRDALIGGLTVGAGAAAARLAAPLAGEAVVAGRLSAPAARIASDAARIGAEATTLTVAPAALEGRMPEPEDFLNAAILIAGLHSAGVVAGKLRAVYARTGREPMEVAADAKRDPTIASELQAADAVLPRAYDPLMREVNAADAVPGVKAEAVARQPFAEVSQSPGEPARPTEVNYNYLNTSDDVKAAMSRLSQVYELEIQTQRRSTVNWDQTQMEAGRYLADLLGSAEPVVPREPGTPAGAAELLARKQMVVGAADDMAARARELTALGTNASAEQTAAFLASIDRAAMIQSEFLGARAEAGRALNILKDTRVAADRAEQIQQLIGRFGNDPATLARMVTELDNATSALKFAREAVQASTWDKMIEAWKAALVSGPFTQAANIMGNATFAALRPVVDAAAAGFGLFSKSADRVTVAEPLARILGNLEGTREGLRLARSAFMSDAAGGRAEVRQAIGGTTGYFIRTPFRALAAGDALFRAMNERGEAYALAAREATAEGLHLATREWRERVAELAQNPTAAMIDQITHAGSRFTFNEALGAKGKAVQRFVKEWHLEWAVPFITTPANVFKEMARLTPAAPVISEWRAAIRAGGSEAQKAYAEMAVGTALSALAMGWALSGHISGQGDPDPKKRAVQMASGWQPYSIKVGDTWYSYQRLQPVGTLLGLAADMAEVWDRLGSDESDKVPRILAVAFANAVKNQTFLQGLANVVDAMSEPDRKGPRFVQNLAGSAVPAAVAQTAQMMDPYVREVSSIREAVQARIPGAREGLSPKRDPFGEPVTNRERLGIIGPITKVRESEDKVRTEAARLGFGVEQAPRSIQLPAGGDRKLGKVQLAPEQRDVFSDVRGHVAHQVLESIVNGPSWDGMPDLIKLRTYQLVFEKANAAGRAAAMTAEQRQAEVDRITGELVRRLSR